MKNTRVIDLSRLLPGPFATLCLQGLGAEVVKIEDPAGGDFVRHVPPRIGEHGAWFTALNRGKRSVALDLKRPDGRDALLALLGEADVLVESFRPGVLARLGLAPTELRTRFPRLVIASLTGWGQTGPYAQLPGHDIGFLAIAGLLGHADPTVPKLQWADLAAGGLAAALRIAGALLDRSRTGEGAWLDIAMLDGLIGLQQTQFATLAAGAPPDELLTGGVPAYGLYRCSDGGWVSVAALEPPFLAVLRSATDDLSTQGLTRLFAGAPRDAWLERLGGACVVPVLTLAEVARDPQVAARGLFREDGLAHPPTGPVDGSVPMLGEHTQAELARVGYVRA
ncbi:MAG: CaiB/BaiF CoA-transferase family protein [Pseudomonadota bacterium]|nr:CaiB/BaiF CoA-transferase family protein [Pseudomonadota bacterium]